ncbi:hypothetical protein [Paenibacillus chitinolyticus]|uniref:hypothetical protein n=1 Tax=Paenibacillus chitinolyticus TaxID=79263 RepID=UPI003671FCD5
MFKPYFFDLLIGHSNIDLREVELQLIKSAREKYNFKSAEMLQDSIQLQDAFPIFKCVIKEEYTHISSALFNELEDIKNFIYLLDQTLDFNDINIISIELLGSFNLIESRELFNLNFNHHEISGFDFEISVKDEESNKTILHFVKSDEGLHAVTRTYPQKNVSNLEEMFVYLEKKSNDLKDTMIKITENQSHNLIFSSIEVEQP